MTTAALEENMERFSRLLLVPKEELLVSAGVGTLSEKYLHALLKYYYEPDPDYHEVGIDRYTADICRGMDIIEIQTRSLHRLYDKLDYYLSEGYRVTIVSPIPRRRYISWLDSGTGEISKKRLSPKKGTPYDFVNELYGIRNYLANENVRVILELLDVWDIKNTDGYGKGGKRRATRCDRLPLGLCDEIILDTPEDYRIFLPDSLPEIFTAQEYSAQTHLKGIRVSGALKILIEVGLIERAGERGRKYLYRRV